MKRYTILVITIVSILSSCKKEKFQTQALANITLVNAISGGGAIRVSTNGNDSVLVNTTKAYGFVANPNVKMTAYASGKPSSPYYSSDLSVNNGDIYSLFVFGQFPNGEGILLKEKLPTFKAEECGIRVINLSPNGINLKVTLSATPTINEFSSLVYKQITEFKTYSIPFTAAPANFTFQVRNDAGTVLASYPFTTANISGIRYDSATLVIRGLVGGTGTSALGITFVPHY